MVKRSRVYCTSSISSGGGGVGNRRSRVAVTVGLLVLHILLCGGGAVLGSSLGAPDTNWSAQQNAAERTSGAGRWVADDATATAARNSRSAANLSHITGTARKIKMFIKNRYLQVFPDGTVNSTVEDTSDYGESIFF